MLIFKLAQCEIYPTNPSFLRNSHKSLWVHKKWVCFRGTSKCIRQKSGKRKFAVFRGYDISHFIIYASNLALPLHIAPSTNSPI